MKLGCLNCQKGSCYHIDIDNLTARIEILQLAVDMLEERLSSILDTQHMEPYIIDVSDEDADKLKKFAMDERYNLPLRFRDIANGE